jgi:hypothetical protein
MKNFLKKWLSRQFERIQYFTGSQELHDIVMESKYFEILNNSTNPLLANYYRGFSQLDEDTIIANILDRLDIDSEFPDTNEFVEIGVGDGTENNTLTLLVSGWKGLWFGGQDLIIKSSNDLNFIKLWITRKNLADEIIPRIKDLKNLKLLSLDLDGNDYWFASDLLGNGIRPDVWVQEYNGSFGPKTKWTIPYDENHVCKYDGYWGASIALFVQLFNSYGYNLIACNASGANAFFVKSEFMSRFADVPDSTAALYMPPRRWLYKSKNRVSPKIAMGINIKDINTN